MRKFLLLDCFSFFNNTPIIYHYNFPMDLSSNNFSDGIQALFIIHNCEFSRFDYDKSHGIRTP